MRAVLLVGEGIIEQSNSLPHMHETGGTRRDKYNRLQISIRWHNLHLQAARIGRLADIRLHQGHSAADRRPHDVGAATIDFGDALLRSRKLRPKRLKLGLRYGRELLKRMSCLADASFHGDLLLGKRSDS